MASDRAGRRALFAAAWTLAGLVGACAGESARGAGSSNRAGGGMDAGASPGGGSTGGAGGVTILEGSGGFVPAAGAGPVASAVGGPDCATRPAASCTGIESSSYHSTHGAFDASPELAACSAYVSFDGCGKLIYAFDDNGCATFVDPGPGGWQQSDHLYALRDCLSAAFSRARFTCLASRTFAFYESCFVH